MAKMSFSDFIKYANAYEQYLALSEDPPKQDPPKQDPPKQDPPKQDPPKQDPPKQDPDWQTIETSLAEILKRMDAAPKPSIDDVKPETVDDVIKKILI